MSVNFNAALEDPTPEPESLPAIRVMSLEAVKPQFLRIVAEVDRMVADAQAVDVADPDREKFAVALGGQAKKIAKALEAKEKELTQEARDYVAAVRGFVDGFTDRLIANTKKSNTGCIEIILKKKIGDYQHTLELQRREQEQRARAAAEELRRKLEAEAEEANRKAREAAMKKAAEEAERQRIIAEEEARKRKASQEEMRALAAEAEAERLEAMKRAEEEAKANEIQAPTVPDPIMPAQESIVRTETGSSSYQQKRWDFEIVDPAAVPREFCSPDQKKIREMITAGVRELAGVRIYEETITKFRA